MGNKKCSSAAQPGRDAICMDPFNGKRSRSEHKLPQRSCSRPFPAALVTGEHHEMKVTISVLEGQCYAGGAATVARATCPDRRGITRLTSPKCPIPAPAEE
jgi:hypothetical protein